MRRASLLLLLVALVGAGPARAYKFDHAVVPQPRLQYFVALSDWKKPFKRVVRAVNRAHVGVRLVQAKIPEQATIQVGRLKNHRCGLPGVDGTTQTLAGGYAAIYLPRGCHGAHASILAGHELGHALGLLHEDRRCALMNSSGTGPKGIPTRCLGRRIDWLHHPYRPDDIRGLKRLYRNTPPKAHLALANPGRTTVAGDDVRFTLAASDRERNISELKLDFGDGSGASGFSADELPTAHAYDDPGRYTAKLTVIDLYLRRATATVTVTVEPR
jgi:hypothetical protein